jgi:hypothetical protein
MAVAVGRWGAIGEGLDHRSLASIDRSASSTWVRQSSWAVWLDQRTVGEGHHRSGARGGD